MATISLALTDEQRALKAGVTEICRRYPGEYWRDLDSRREYPEKFVDERWKSELSERQLWWFGLVAGRVNKRLGYGD